MSLEIEDDSFCSKVNTIRSKNIESDPEISIEVEVEEEPLSYSRLKTSNKFRGRQFQTFTAPISPKGD